LPEDRRKLIAIAAAKADVAAESHRLGALVDLSKTYRTAGDSAAAARLLRENSNRLVGKIDVTTAVRAYWFEWGVAEGTIDNGRSQTLNSIWLQGLSLADFLRPDPITPERVKRSCAGLGVSFGRLATPSPTCPFALGRRAAAAVGLLSEPDLKASRYFRLHHREADKLKTRRPKSVEQAFSWLTSGILHAGRKLEDAFLISHTKGKPVSFELLFKFLQDITASREAPKRPQQQIASATDIKPALREPTIDDRVQAAIDRVAREAWALATKAESPEDGIKLAKLEATRLFPTLSPHVRRQVVHHFTSQKWTPLLERAPKEPT
jgi:hypothetical protein